MRQKIEKALTIINLMRVDGDNQDLAVAAKQELKKTLELLAIKEYVPENFEKEKEKEETK